MRSFGSVGAAVDFAVRELRGQLADPTAPIAVLAPNHLNNRFVRRGLAAEGPQIRIYDYTPETLVGELSTRALAAQGLRPETFRRRSALTTELIARLAETDALEPYTTTLTSAGWRHVVAATLARLESEGLSSEELTGVRGDESVQRRVAILRAILSALERRRSELRLAGPNEVREAAMEGLDDPQVPCNAMKAVVVLGDRDLERSIHLPLSAWIATRPFARIALAPLENVKVGEIPSLRAIGTPTLTVTAQADAGALRSLQQHLFRAPTGESVERDPSVRLLRTPDEVRENEEVVRLVQSAIIDGTALDRIAVVCPDAEGREPLATALQRAGIPATWFVTRPMSEAPSAKFLLLALSMAAGAQGSATWYDLLRQRRLRLKANLKELPVAKGRWRRYLADCGAFSGASNIVRALRALSPTQEDPVDRSGSLSLATTIETLATELEGLCRDVPLSAFARSCSTFLAKWWRHSADRAQLLAALESLAVAGEGVSVDFATAVEELRATLDATQLQEGDLGQAAIRVLPPMACAGADFDVVFVTGLVQGRFPVRRSPDPILNNAVVDAIRERHPDVVLQHDPDLVEARRFAAAASAARRALVLSIPAFEGLADRPRIPGTFALDALSSLLGRRATYRDLDRELERRGSLAQPFPETPAEAITSREFLVAKLASGDDDYAAQLTSHRFARNLVRLHRDLCAAREGQGSAPETTDPDQFRLPALDGEPLSASDLVELVKTPGAFLFRRVLRAYPPRRLRDHFDPLSSWWRDDQLTRALRRACEDQRPLAQALAEHWERAVADAVELNDLDDDIRRVVVELGHRQCERLRVLVGDDFGELEALDTPAHVAADTPWRVVPGVIRTDEGAVIELLSSMNYLNDTASVIKMLALEAHGMPVGVTRAIAPSGETKNIPLAKYRDSLVTRLRHLATLADAGIWPWGGAAPWTMEHDDVGKLDDERLAILASRGEL